MYRYREAVTSLVTEDHTVTGVRTQNGEYHAPRVIIAAGTHATRLCQMAGLDLPVLPGQPRGRDLGPGPGVPGSPGRGPPARAEGKTINFYFGQDSDGQIIFCYTPKEKFPGENRTSTFEFMPIVAARLVNLIPRLKNLTIRRVWRGLYPMTPDGNPIVGKAPNVNGLLLGIGMCGQGFMLGPGVGHEPRLRSRSTGKPAIDPAIFDLLSPARDLYGGKKESLK